MNIGRHTLTGRSGWRHFCATLLFCAVAAITSSAQSFNVLATFDGTNGSGPDGLTQGFDGNFYGTTLLGGTGSVNGVGTVFVLSRTGSLKTLYNFCPTFPCGGYEPEAGVIQATDGNFYGTTSSGGYNICNGGCGTVYKITKSGEVTTLHNFGETDGSLPQDPLIQATDGNFYGTTLQGGARCLGAEPCAGTVFRMTPAGKLTTIHSFCLQTGCPDGASPYVGVVQATDGNLYGSTSSTIFRITPTNEFTTLYTFCSQPNCADGSNPRGLVQGADGNLYGTTVGGGANGQGTIFQITPGGNLTTLHSFCSGTNCPDGSRPMNLIQATDGNFYGVTQSGGINCGTAGCGTIFSFTISGQFTTLYSFCPLTNCPDGVEPAGDLMQGTDGSFYGTSDATVFSLSTGLGPFVKLDRSSGKVGQTGSILGQGFTGTTGVFLNGTPASFTVVSDTHIRATVPVGATSGYVTVNTPSGTLTSNVPFQIAK
jgi:uncharacterized repeat protein (TIGR03803 family)